MMMSIFNSLFLLAFLMSAAAQYNDPDALAWIAIYLAASWMCLVQFRKRQPRWLPPTLLAICLIWIGTLLPNIVGQVSLQEIMASISMKTKAVEEAREIGGLTIVATWAAILVVRRGF
jgi:Transmembrane family 220, helix